MKLLIIFVCLFTFIPSVSKAKSLCADQKKLRSFNPTYAKGFSIDYYQDFKIIKSHFNRDEFIIAEKGLTCKSDLFVFTSNPKRMAATSTTHLFTLKEFNLMDRLKGFQGKKYISQKDFKTDKVSDLNFMLDKEELIVLGADLVMAYSGNFQNDNMIFEYRKLKIPVILNYDFVEKHPLARLEWMIFTSAFFNLENKAEALFLEKSKKYLKAKAQFEKDKKIKVLVGDIQEGKWATPGVLSNLGVLIHDAGGELVLRRSSDKTQFLSIESVVGIKEKIDLWLTHNFWTDKSEINKDARYKLFRKLKTFNNNKKTNNFGYNDYWEDAQNYPEVLIVELHDLFNGKTQNQTWYQELK